MLRVTSATQEFKVVSQCILRNVDMQWLMQGFGISWIPFVPFFLLSARLGCRRRHSTCSFYEFMPRGEHKTLGLTLAKFYRANGITPFWEKKDCLFCSWFFWFWPPEAGFAFFWNPSDTKIDSRSVSPKRLQWVQLDSLWAEDLRTSWLQLCLESFWNALHRALRCLAGLSKDVKVQTSTGRFYNSAVCPSMSIIGSNNCHIACRRKRHLKYFKVFTVELIVQCTICSSGVLLLSTKPYMELYCIHLYTVLIYTHTNIIYI